MAYPRLDKLYTSTKNRSREVENMIRSGNVGFEDWEQILQELELNAWLVFLKKAENWNFSYHRLSGLKGLSELMNEAKGYVFLKKIGCGEIRFIPEGGIKTPDIEAGKLATGSNLRC